MSDDLYRGDTQVSNPNNVKTIFHRYSLTGAYRISDRFILQATVPFIDATFEEDGVVDKTISGLGDASLLGRWRPWAGDSSNLSRLNFSFGVILPTGKDRDQPIIGVAAPSVFQEGTGAFQLLLGMGYSQTMGDWTYATQLNMSLPLGESSQGFRPAESYFLNVSAGRPVTDSLSLRLALLASYSTEDEFNNIELANTGSFVLAVKPSLVWQISDDVSMSGSVSIPLYRDVNETGIATGPTLSLGFSKSF